MPSLHVVIMAKRPRPGRVKTRLARSRGFDPSLAAECAAVLLDVSLRRLAGLGRPVVALGGPAWDEFDDGIRSRVAGVRIVEQGDGDLGQRLQRVWRRLDDVTPIVFFVSPRASIATMATTAMNTSRSAYSTSVAPSSSLLNRL